MNEFEYMICRIEENFEIYNPKDFIKKHKLATKSRVRDYVILRQELMFRIRNRTKLSLTDIGKLFNRDHATVISGIKQVKNMRTYNDSIYNDIVDKYQSELKQLNFNML
jgi:chromosomal replication initiator protein